MTKRSSARIAAPLAVAGLLLQAACSPDGRGISEPDAPELRYSLAGGYTVVTAQLDATTSDASAWGHVQLKFLPPNPVFPTDPVQVAITGIIFNPDGDDISTGAGLYLGDIGLGDGGVFVAPFTAPGGPPIRVALGETITISAELAGQLTSSAGDYTVRYGSIAGRLSGGRAIPGSPPI